jgi:nicotinamidase-related amidase
MDFQHAIVETLSAPSVVDAAARAATGARKAGIPVMFVRVGFRPGYPEISPSNSTFSAITARAGDAYTEGHPATQVHAALAPLDGEPVIVKRRVSAFSGSDRDPEVHRVLTEKVIPRQALVTTADEWIASLPGEPA